MAWRTGRSQPHNLYEGEELRGQLLTPEHARRIVGLLERGEARDASWLVKDFNALYRASKAVVESMAEGSVKQVAETASDLRGQLVRLGAAFQHTEAVRTDLMQQSREAARLYVTLERETALAARDALRTALKRLDVGAPRDATADAERLVPIINALSELLRATDGEEG